ncbi:MAG: type I-E CRISPR-associated protein Cas7/Cse4/CasC [Chloracidobacterium sp.]
MFIEIHILQNFAPSSLNRDENNSPKTCLFGGYRRARISSQCLKRSIRFHPSFKAAVESHQGSVAVRTRRLFDCLVNGLTTKGHTLPDAELIARNTITGLGFKIEEKETNSNGQKVNLTEYLMFLGQQEIEVLVDVAHRNAQVLVDIQAEEMMPAKTEKKMSKIKIKEQLKAAIPKHIQKELLGVFKPAYPADVAMFGRMVADEKKLNVDAACQVAHAFSTNELTMEIDFFTAIDDIKSAQSTEDQGSDMIGTVEYNSSTYYRYVQVNLNQLFKNLNHDLFQTRGALHGLIEATALAVPGGKQNSMTAQNPPDYIRVLVRANGAPWSLANAFLEPVRPDRKNNENILALSVSHLNAYLNNLKAVYGDDGILEDLVCTTLTGAGNGLSLAELIAKVLSHIQTGPITNPQPEVGK